MQTKSPPRTNRGANPPITPNSPYDNVDILDLTAGIDYLTCTTRDDRAGYAWHRLCKKLATYKKYEPTSSRRLMYEGTSWEGHLFVGHNDAQGWIAMLAGPLASLGWQEIAPTARRVSRLDLAVTVTLKYPMTQLVKMGYELNKASRQRRYSIVQTSQGGSTLYIGSRQSRQFGRLYDKGAQQGEKPGVTWRYEVEIKDKPRNLTLLNTLYQQWTDDKPYLKDICSYVWRWYDARDIRPVFPYNPKFGKNMIHIETEMVANTNERRLAWLRTQVSPTVARLVEAGLGKQVNDALGLSYHQNELFPKEDVNVDN